MTALFETTRLGKSYGMLKALEDVTLAIHEASWSRSSVLTGPGKPRWSIC